MSKKINIFLILICVVVFCGYKTREPPKVDDKKIAEYLKILYNKINILEVLTSTPNGVVTGSYGEVVLLNNSGTYYLEICTSSPSGTVWKGAILATTP